MIVNHYYYWKGYLYYSGNISFDIQRETREGERQGGREQYCQR